MRALTIALCLLTTPALADVVGIASVIDSDTIEIHGQRIRLHGVDALSLEPIRPSTISLNGPRKRNGTLFVSRYSRSILT